MQRRSLIALLGLAPAAGWPQAPAAAPMSRPIPSTGEALPVIGLGTWITFNVGRDIGAAAGACGQPAAGASPSNAMRLRRCMSKAD